MKSHQLAVTTLSLTLLLGAGSTIARAEMTKGEVRKIDEVRFRAKRAAAGFTVIKMEKSK